jgi:hypothetical protein
MAQDSSRHADFRSPIPLKERIGGFIAIRALKIGLGKASFHQAVGYSSSPA